MARHRPLEVLGLNTSMRRLTASLVFDAPYLEPALLTAFELRRVAERFEQVVLVLLDDAAGEVAEAAELVGRFCQRMNQLGGLSYRAIQLHGGLPTFSAYHFNASILYKAIAPSFVPGDGWLLNIDAGILLGDRFEACLDQAIAELETDEDWLLAAHTHETEGRIPERLRALPHHALYPAGNLLLFHPQRCRAAHWHERFLAGCMAWHEHLRYAEQELICLLAKPYELRALPFAEQRCALFLGLERLLGQAPWPQPQLADDSVFFKIVGSIKPWKQWVLDPLKAIYLQRRQALEAVFPLTGLALIERHRQHCSHEPWRQGFYQAYEAQLLRQLGAPA